MPYWIFLLFAPISPKQLNFSLNSSYWIHKVISFVLLLFLAELSFSCMLSPVYSLSLFNIHYSSLFPSGYGRHYSLYYRYFHPPKTPLLLINSNFSYLSNLLKHAQALSNSPGVPMLEVSTSAISIESIKSGGLRAVLQGKINDLLVCLFCQLS